MGLLTLYEVKQDYLPIGREHNRPGTPLNPQGMVIHETADAGETDENEDAYFRGAYRSSSAHTFIDWDSITELIPENEEAWHAGPTANAMYLGLELCRPATHDHIKFAEVWKRGVWYTALKFYQHGWQTGPGLWSHAGISNKYRETDHQDPISYFAEYVKTFADYVSDVDAMINQMKSEARGGDDVLDVAVLLYSKEDYWAGTDVSDKNGNCALFIRPADKSVPKDAKSAKKLIVVGGPTTGLPNEVLLSGKTKYDTAAIVAKYLG